ncbi:MAG TPA: hypothetical protein GXX28_01230 [Firmicutes bacterium]|nr:hypothetical protein [Bacillota bacterium]
MRLSGLKVEAVVAAFAVTAALVFGLQWAVRRYQVEQPLLRAAARVEGVRRAEVSFVGGRPELVVTMGSTSDFRESYQQLEGLMRRAFGEGAGRVVVRDSRTPRLARALYEVNFAVQEGLATGRFTEMRGAVESAAERLKLPPPYLWVEDNRVYLGLRDGRAVLYAVVEHKAAQTGDAVTEGGGPVG